MQEVKAKAVIRFKDGSHSTFVATTDGGVCDLRHLAELWASSPAKSTVCDHLWVDGELRATVVELTGDLEPAGNR